MMPETDLTDWDKLRYEWQMWLPGFGEAAQRKLKAATVLISRCGGVGGVVAQQLAAAGVGRLILATGGKLKESDLNRQLLQTPARLGQVRVEQVARQLQEFRPDLRIEAIPENMTPALADRWVPEADVVVDGAPLFPERLALNDASVRHGKPMVECAMYAWTGYVTVVLPRQSACLRCIFPEPPPDWKRQFPVLGAVSGTAAAIGAAEVVKLLTGLGRSLAGRLLTFDLECGRFREMKTRRLPECPVCGAGGPCEKPGGS